jgi:S-adenosylmethionine:tRNA ribosyltransferase-isomerase
MDPILDKHTISMADYSYELPEEKIAQFPLEKRDEAKMLVYRSGQIEHKVFKNLEDYLQEGNLLVFNNTKVIPARLYFRRATGALIEIFLLQPEKPSKILSVAMQQNEGCSWGCMIGNKRKWKTGEVLERVLQVQEQEVTVTATLEDSDKMIVNFSWDPSRLRFVDIVQAFGELPLPPYLNREVTEKDKNQYQTVYSKNEGAVAAPTAGLHFTERLLARLEEKGIRKNFLTLHVSAGTFQPVKEENALHHPMHSEQLVFNQENIQLLIDAADSKTIAVGTTSMRALESLYWFGVKLIKLNNTEFTIAKLLPYQWQEEELPGKKEALQAVQRHMQEQNLQELIGETEIFIFPGYRLRMCQGLITNYHLPGTTLLLLVAALIGDDWKRVYQEALDNNYRFLSFGDSSLLLP